MKLKAYKTKDGTYSLRVAIESSVLSTEELETFVYIVSSVYISKEMYISIYKVTFPVINVDEYFNYLYLTDISFDISFKELTYRLLETFPILLDILETKYGIEYVDAES